MNCHRVWPTVADEALDIIVLRYRNDFNAGCQGSVVSNELMGSFSFNGGITCQPPTAEVRLSCFVHAAAKTRLKWSNS